MTPLSLLTIVTALLSIVTNIHLVLHPETVGWKRSTARAFGGVTAILCVVLIILALTQSHGKA